MTLLERDFVGQAQDGLGDEIGCGWVRIPVSDKDRRRHSMLRNHAYVYVGPLDPETGVAPIWATSVMASWMADATVEVV